jgi:hypothetical protein
MSIPPGALSIGTFWKPIFITPSRRFEVELVGGKVEMIFPNGERSGNFS